jgi:alpha-beta hydrolase superfamily lysophospholipase
MLIVFLFMHVVSDEKKVKGVVWSSPMLGILATLSVEQATAKLASPL